MCVLQIVFSIPNDIMLHPFPIPSWKSWLTYWHARIWSIFVNI
jgi:hypothetical protein